MAPDIDIYIDLDTGEIVARERRIPHAVWINRPAHPERGAVRPAGVIAGAIALAAALALGALVTHNQPLVPPAAAGTTAEPTGNGPTGYFPDAFAPVRGEIEPLPPTF
jgi:hypothetical protein